MKWVNNADLLERRLLAQQGNISKHAIYRTVPWVNRQILKMTPNRTPAQTQRELHRMAVWFEAWADSQEFPVSLFPTSVLLLTPTAPSLCWHTGNDTEEVMIHRKIMHGPFCQPAMPETLGILISDCMLFTAEAVFCFGHVPPQCKQPSKACTHWTLLHSPVVCSPVLY